MLEKFVTSTPRPVVHRNRYTKFQQKMHDCCEFDNNNNNNGDHNNAYRHHHDIVAASRNRSRGVFLLNLLLVSLAVVLVCVVCCQLTYNAALRVMKAFAVGIIAVYFSWEVVYFDSSHPGVSPPSPLSPQKSREITRYSIHTSYLFSVINAVLLMIMVYLWL